MSQPVHATLAEARVAPIQPGRQSSLVMEHGSMTLRYYAPRGLDRQTPHDQDEPRNRPRFEPDEHRSDEHRRVHAGQGGKPRHGPVRPPDEDHRDRQDREDDRVGEE